MNKLKVLEIMEFTGINQLNLVLSYIRDGLAEIADANGGDVKRRKYDVQANTRIYNLPSDFGKLKGVYAIDDNGYYRGIPEAKSIDFIDDTEEDTDVVVI